MLNDGLLTGLDWDNVFAARGIALDSLLIISDAPNFKHSDIDLYIYELGPQSLETKFAKGRRCQSCAELTNGSSFFSTCIDQRQTNGARGYSSDNVLRPLPNKKFTSEARSGSERGPSEFLFGHLFDGMGRKGALSASASSPCTTKPCPAVSIPGIGNHS